jgi:hypothetical protein
VLRTFGSQSVQYNVDIGYNKSPLKTVCIIRREGVAIVIAEPNDGIFPDQDHAEGLERCFSLNDASFSVGTPMITLSAPLARSNETPGFYT